MLKLVLAQEDYDVHIATSVREALDLASNGEFDVYVLDRRLPDGNGLELCQKLTQITPDVPCIFYSGDAYEIHRHQAIAAGADGYVVKPDIERLINTIRDALAKRECAAAATS